MTTTNMRRWPATTASLINRGSLTGQRRSTQKHEQEPAEKESREGATQERAPTSRAEKSGEKLRAENQTNEEVRASTGPARAPAEANLEKPRARQKRRR